MIYAIVVTYNGMQWLSKCLGSLVNSSVTVKVVVIDNGSTDGSQAFISNNFPQIDLIQLKTNLGFGKANNLGIKKAYDSGADYFFLFNQDAWVENDTIEKLVSIYKTNIDYGIISPIHLNGKGDALDLRFSYYISPDKCPNLLSDSILNKIEDKVYETKFVNAAAWLINRNCIETIGGFNPVFHMYGEDDNFIHRIHFHGLKVGVYPLVYIYHGRVDLKKEIQNKEIEKRIKNRLIVKYSNPIEAHDLKQEVIWAIKGIIKAFLRMNRPQFNNEFQRLKLINSIKNEIEANKKICMEKGMQFLLL